MNNPNSLPRNQRLEAMTDLAVFLGGADDDFTGDLLRLIAKAGSVNQARLTKAFPDAVWGWRIWSEGKPDITVGALEDLLHTMRVVWPGRHWEG